MYKIIDSATFKVAHIYCLLSRILQSLREIWIQLRIVLSKIDSTVVVPESIWSDHSFGSNRVPKIVALEVYRLSNSSKIKRA